MFDRGMNTKRMVATLHEVLHNLKSYVAVVLMMSVLLTSAACSTDPDEGGIIGTGIMLRGAVSESTFALQNIVEVKSSDGQLTQLTIDAARQFSTTSLSGTGPWVLAVRSSADHAVYGIAYSDGTRNINRFSDLSLRSWFARQLLDLDTEFMSSDPIGRLPTATEYAESVSSVFQLIQPVLDSYNVSGEEAISADYNNNDQGIDAFLNRNSVLPDNSFVSFVLTDPVTNTQSITRSTLKLDSLFRDNGSIAPSVPGSVKALGSASDEIVLVWDPSTDDVGVIEYRIVRDGSLIGTTPYPVYIDSGLIISQSSSYQVFAVDGAGNVSAPSESVLGSPLLGNDDVPPPAPQPVVQVAASGSAIRLLWAQADIRDVVSFNLYRGNNEQTLNLLFRLTASLATDTAVQENETYCYQVTAVDASGNESAGSEILCITASDDATVNTNIPLDGWIVPDLDSLNCDQLLSSAQVQQGNTVITAGCYSVPETLTIGAGATLTLSKGVVLKFGELAKLLIPSDATLTSNGTPAAPVVLTGEIAVRGYWGGIEFQGSRSAGNLIRGTVVQYAGGADTRVAINVTTGASRFRMEDTLVRFNQDYAIKFDFNGIVIDKFRGNRITENDSIGLVALEVMESMIGNSEYTGNVDDEIQVTRRSYTDARITVPDLGIPLSWNGIKFTRGTLTIEPGVKFSMVPGSIVDVEGKFTAVGTAELPIVMKGKTTQPGSWNGLRLSGRGDKRINHFTMSFAGDARQDTGAIEVVCTTDNVSSFTIDNVEITDSQSWGIFVSGEGCSTQIGNNISYANNALGDISIP